MKLSGVTLSIGILVLTGCLFSQTRVPPSQIKPQPNTGVYVSVTSKGMVLATVDPATIVLDTTGTTPVLRAIVPVLSPPAINEKHVSILPAAGVTAVTIPDNTYIPASLGVYVNGLLQSVTNDYSLVGTTVTLIRPSETGDTVQLTYRF